jgi:hypothetical protein
MLDNIVLRGTDVSKKKHVKVDLQGELLDKFERIKKYYGLTSNTETLRLCISALHQMLEADNKI